MRVIKTMRDCPPKAGKLLPTINHEAGEYKTCSSKEVNYAGLNLLVKEFYESYKPDDIKYAILSATKPPLNLFNRILDSDNSAVRAAATVAVGILTYINPIAQNRCQITSQEIQEEVESGVSEIQAELKKKPELYTKFMKAFFKNFTPGKSNAAMATQFANTIQLGPFLLRGVMTETAVPLHFKREIMNNWIALSEKHYGKHSQETLAVRLGALTLIMLAQEKDIPWCRDLG